MDNLEFDERAEFYRKLECYYTSKPGKKPYNLDDINTMIQAILNAKTNKSKKTRHEYYLLHKYDIYFVNENQYLICKKKIDDNIKFIVPYEELYDRINDYHIQTGHGGNVKLRMALTNKYAVPRPAIEAFLSTCVLCNCKKGTKRKLVTESVISKSFNERGQIDFIDFESMPDGKFKWILIYQDHHTKFLSLRPLETKEPDEIAMNLLSIFLTFGAPKIIQSDNIYEFVNSIIEKLTLLWPECVIIYRQSIYLQSNNSIEIINEDIENMLKAWMLDNKSKKWSIGLQFVQLQKNSSYHCEIDKSPYKALFGKDPKTSLNNTNRPIEFLKIEEDSEISDDEEPKNVLK